VFKQDIAHKYLLMLQDLKIYQNVHKSLGGKNV